MKCYIANASAQVQELYFWLPEVSRPVMQRLNMGQQELLAHRELTKDQLDAVLAQLHPYGVANIKDIDREKKFSGLCYQLDKPINVEDLKNGVQRNQEVLEARSREAREMSTAAIHEDLQKQTKGGVKGLEVETSEQPPQSDPDKDTRKETLTIGNRTNSQNRNKR